MALCKTAASLVLTWRREPQSCTKSSTCKTSESNFPPWSQTQIKACLTNNTSQHMATTSPVQSNRFVAIQHIYPAKIQLQLKFCEISVVHNIILVAQSFCNLAQSIAVSLLGSVQNFRLSEHLRNKLWANELSQDLSLTHLPLLMLICVSESGQHWFR